MATPRLVARITGSLYTAGGVAVGAAGLDTTAPVLISLAALALLAGPPVVAWGRLLPRWSIHVLVGTGTALIATAVVYAPDAGTAVAAAGVGTFVALDAFFFFAWPGAVVQLVGLTLALWATLVARGDVPIGAVVTVAVVMVAVALTTGELVRRASSASQDPLTGLANRRGFDDALEELLRAATRSGEPLSAALLDIDHFTSINDTRGHAAGDDLLRRVAAHCTPLLPAGAVLARHGGDEFALLVPGASGPVALAVVEQLRQGCPDVGLSCGVTELRPGEGASQVMRRADLALYQAKAAGRGRSVLEDSGPDPLAADLASALGGDPAAAGLTVHYQAVVDVADGSVAGVEALARLTHPRLGPVPPSRFVPLAETSGLIGALGTHVLRTACADLAGVHERTGRRLWLTVNVSGHQLCDPAFPDRVAAALADSGWPAASTVLEVTETLLEADSPTAVAALESMRRQGLSVAIDDFGTGYSSLARRTPCPQTT